MNAVVCVVAVVVLVVGPAVSGPVSRSKRWSQRTSVNVPAPSVGGNDLALTLATSPDIMYTDYEQKLTALKSSAFKACFIVDLDPGFYLLVREMEKIVTEQTPTVINSPPARFSLRQRAGPYITAMCEFSDIYWLNNAAPPLPASGNHPTGTLPEPIHVQVNDSPLSGGTGVAAPPPVNVYRQQQALAPASPSAPSTGAPVPPPVGLYHQQADRDPQQQVSVPSGSSSSSSSSSGGPAPPPVDLYHQQTSAPSGPEAPPPLSVWQQSNPAPSSDDAVAAPPPLNVWRQMNGN